MSVIQTLIGNVKGPKGDTGSTGATGATGPAATITVGTTTTTAYGNSASVTNSGTSSAAVLDFVIPQGRPGQATTTIGDLVLDSMTTSTASFPSPAVDDTGKVAFGKIVKFFSDTVTALTGKLDTSKVANNLTTTESGYALDARQGKALNDSLSGRFLRMYGFEKVTITGAITTVPAGDFDIAVTFDHELSAVPSLLIGLMPQTYTQFVSAYSFSKTGCHIRIHNSGSAYTTTQLLMYGLAVY